MKILRRSVVEKNKYLIENLHKEISIVVSDDQCAMIMDRDT